MRKRLASLALVAATIFGAYANNDDPVLMTIDGKDVKLSEFEYLYNKNNSQQAQQQSVDEYLDMFVVYKLKVADAQAAGIDTTASFKSEFKGHRNDLAMPYLQDNSTIDRLTNEAYTRMQEDVNVSHIMIHISEDPAINKASKERLDSIRQEILAGNATFEEMAAKFSTDHSTNQRGGSMGWIVANRWPYSFEKAAWDTPKEGVSEVIETFAGFHIIKVNDRRQAQGQVYAKHILKLTQGKTPEEAAKAKEQIDSLYNELAAKSPEELSAAFSEAAGMYSECPSGRNGGDLGWFGIGQMVREFEDATFALPDGCLSQPVRTQFGWHIIYRVNSKGIGTLDDCKPSILMAINNDERGMLPQKEMAEKMIKKHNAVIIEENMTILINDIKSATSIDSVINEKYANSDMPIIRVGDETVPVKNVISMLPKPIPSDKNYVEGMVRSITNSLVGSSAIDYENRHLEEYYPEFGNLVNEYHDGILLYEISNRNVWEKASKDKDGLEQFFQANKAKYDNWESKKYKGFIIFASNDSIMKAAKKFLKGKKLDVDSVAPILRKEFGAKNIRVERVIAAKGENAIVDYVAFGGKKPANDKNKWQYYFGYMGKKIKSPEEAADVRGLVTSDYQAYLEKEWVEQLRKKYNVVINYDVLELMKNK